MQEIVACAVHVASFLFLLQVGDKNGNSHLKIEEPPLLGFRQSFIFPKKSTFPQLQQSLPLVSILHAHFQAKRERRFFHFLQRGKMVAKNFAVDLSKPMVFQVGHLGDAYDEWVHDPIVSKEGPRFFQNSFCEFFTRTRWWVIPTVWVPVASWFISNSVKLGIPSSNVALMVLSGIFAWTLAEYLLHRFLFHVKTTSYWGNTAHYLLHGCHHKHPQDHLRLVFPPVAATGLAIPIWNLVKVLCPPSTSPAVFGGILLGYVMYDCTHYFLHHGQPKSDVPKSLKKYHLNHHYRMQNYGFGITSPLWDIIFRTVPPSTKMDAKRR